MNCPASIAQVADPVNLLVLTSSARRHRALIWRLSQFALVNAIVEDFRPLILHGPSQALIAKRIKDVEERCFPSPQTTSIPGGELRFCPWESLRIPADWMRDADWIVVYGSSMIREPLLSQISPKAVNLHAGWAPQYRGSHCNFWALHDGQPEYVGMTIQTLDRDVDAGAIWQQVGTQPGADPILYAMRAVKAGFDVLAQFLAMRWHQAPKAQDISQLIRYSKHADYTEGAAHAFVEKYQIKAPPAGG